MSSDTPSRQPSLPKLSTARLSVLPLPSTVISPPTPISPLGPPISSLASVPHAYDPITEQEVISYDSPEEEDEEDGEDEPERTIVDTLAPTSHLRRPSGTLPFPVAADSFSSSPTGDVALLGFTSSPSSPVSPSGAISETPSAGPSRASTPSSPPSYPRIHRRQSSTHRVREIMFGEQRATETGEVMVNQYRLGSGIGKGSYAKVEMAEDVTSGKIYAIKEFSKSHLALQALQHRHKQSVRGRVRRPPLDPQHSGESSSGSGLWNAGRATPNPGEKEDQLALIRREVAVMKKLDHPNIVHLYEAISVPDADALYMVLEYMPGGVLMHVAMGAAAKDSKPPFSLNQTREFFRQLCLGLEYLHHNEVIHRDIKPDNILLSADRHTVKLCDFGVSEMFVASGDDRIQKSGGSPAFLSPETLTSTINEVHGTAVDIWALGVTLYCMLTGHLPFNFENPIELFEVIRTHDPVLLDEWDEDLKRLIDGMLCKEPYERMIMTTIKNDPWVTENGNYVMISTEDNLYNVGKFVEEPTQEEIKSAIVSLRSIFTAVRALQKMRRLGSIRRSNSSNSGSTPGASPSALRPLSPSTSAHTSVDSYLSLPKTSTSATSADLDDKWRELMIDETLSPASIDEDVSEPGTARQGSGGNPFDKLKDWGRAVSSSRSSSTPNVKEEQKAVDVPQEVKVETGALCESPTSD